MMTEVGNVRRESENEVKSFQTLENKRKRHCLRESVRVRRDKCGWGCWKDRVMLHTKLRRNSI